MPKKPKHPDQNKRENHKTVFLQQQQGQSATFKQITRRVQI